VPIPEEHNQFNMKLNKTAISKWSLRLLIIIALFFAFNIEKTFAFTTEFPLYLNPDGTLIMNVYQILGMDASTTISQFRGITGTYPDDTYDVCGGGGGSDLGSAPWLSGANVEDLVGNTLGCGQPPINSDYWWEFTIDGNIYYARFHFNGVDWSYTEVPEFTSSNTRFTEVTPENNETISSTTAFLYAAGLWIAEDDFSDDLFVRLRYVKNSDLQAAVANTDLLWTEIDFDNDGIGFTTGFNYVTGTTTPLEEGEYTMVWQLKNPSIGGTIASWFGLSNAFGGIVTSTTTSFVVGQRSSFDEFIYNATQGINNFSASTTISTTAIKEYCSLSTSFSMMDCVASFFIPNQQDLDNAITRLNENVFSRFPFGYAYDFISIISTSTIGSLTVINATTSNPVMGNAHIRLDLTNALDPILNATTSAFTNESASSTQTFYEITSYYWKIIIYVMAVFYIMSRVIGGRIIPKIAHKTTN